MITTLYRRLPDESSNRTSTSLKPVTREEFINGVVPVDEFLATEFPPITDHIIAAARRRAARQRPAMLGIDQDWDKEADQ